MVETHTNLAMSAALKTERDRFVAFAFAASDLLLELDKNNVITFIDGATTGFLGGSAQKYCGKSIADLFVDSENENTQAMLQNFREKGRGNQQRAHLTTPIYKSLPVILSGICLPQQQDSLYVTITVLTEEMDDDELQQRDIKSGLFKKQDFAKQATAALAAAREEGKEANISFLDFPGLKEFLDSLDASAAAELTIQIADYLRSKSLGGDTAGIVEEGVYSFVHDASVTTEQMVKEVSEITRKADPKGEGIKANIQTLEGDMGGLTGQDSANAILYTLNRFADEGEDFSLDSIQQGYNEMLSDTMDKIVSFKQTVSDENFELAFQPIVELKHGKIHHFETLVRFDNEKFANPYQFINFGEQTDLIGDFDLSMCHRVIQKLEELDKTGLNPRIAVNLSGRSLSSQLFMDTLSTMLQNASKVKKQMIFEVTETAKIDDVEKANNFIQRLRKDGQLCCLDDFGVGQASFDYLRRLQIDYVKIDGSYVREIITNTRGRTMLRGIVGMCRSMGVDTIGEMVEDEKTAALLWESGVQYGQGWLFGRPSTDTAELKHSNKQCPLYKGALRKARALSADEKQWWSKSGS